MEAFLPNPVMVKYATLLATFCGFSVLSDKKRGEERGGGGTPNKQTTA